MLKVMTIKHALLGGLLAAVASLLAAPLAHAHRIGIPVTTVEWHAPSGLWHVTHRLSVHDFAEAIDGLEADRLETAEAQTLLGRFVIDHFIMAGQSDAIEISYLGAEEDADSFYVYFQVSSPDQTIEIKNELAGPGARDERRHALVNLANGKQTTTLLFTSNDDIKTLDLTRPVAPQVVP